MWLVLIGKDLEPKLKRSKGEPKKMLLSNCYFFNNLNVFDQQTPHLFWRFTIIVIFKAFKRYLFICCSNICFNWSINCPHTLYYY